LDIVVMGLVWNQYCCLRNTSCPSLCLHYMFKGIFCFNKSTIFILENFMGINGHGSGVFPLVKDSSVESLLYTSVRVARSHWMSTSNFELVESSVIWDSISEKGGINNEQGVGKEIQWEGSICV
jgi:hypothetical protein